MKSIHIIENIDNNYGGPAKSVPFLIKYLNNIKINSKIISIQLKENEKNDICESNNIEIVSTKFQGPKFLRFSYKLSNLIKNNLTPNTIIHTQSLWNYPPFCAFKISEKFKIPLVVSIRGNLYDWNLKKSKWKKDLAMTFFQMNMLNNASCIHATEINELKAIRNLGIKTPIALIPNGIETKEFEKLPSKKSSIVDLELDENKKYLLFMSRIDPKKGLEYLINSFIELEKKYKNWDIIIAGPVYNKKYFDDILKKIKDNNIDSKVHIFDMVTGLKRLQIFSISDLFILPAHTENFGMVIGEAMASKIPVITTTGTPWKILNEQNAGWCVDLSQKNITASIELAFNKDSKELEKMGEKCYSIIKNEFTWDSVAEKMSSLYSWLLMDSDKPNFVDI